jgi:PAS domain S-box-containing protein
MILSNSEGIFVDVNIRMCSMLGYDKEELEGKHFNDVTYSEDIAMSNNVVGKLLLDEVRFITFEKRYVRKNGEVFWPLLQRLYWNIRG